MGGTGTASWVLGSVQAPRPALPLPSHPRETLEPCPPLLLPAAAPEGCRRDGAGVPLASLAADALLGVAQVVFLTAGGVWLLPVSLGSSQVSVAPPLAWPTSRCSERCPGHMRAPWRHCPRLSVCPRVVPAWLGERGRHLLSGQSCGCFCQGRGPRVPGVSAGPRCVASVLTHSWGSDPPKNPQGKDRVGAMGSARMAMWAFRGPPD